MNENHQNNGFGYVAFDQELDAKKAIEVINGKEVEDKKIEVTTYKKSGGSEPKFNNLYVKEFPKNKTENDLKAVFGKFGEIVSAFLSVDEAGNSKGFGFVCFKAPDKAKEALEKLHGSTIDGQTLYVS